jgi:hypothetical protein
VRRKALVGLALILGSAAIALAVWLRRGPAYLDEVLAGHGLAGPFATFVVDSIKTMNVKKFDVVEISSHNGEVLFQVTIVPSAHSSFEQFSAQRLYQIDRQFSRETSPYPGSVSNNTQCPAEFLPEKKTLEGQGWTGILVRTFANSRKIFGVCDSSEQHFAVAELILLCTHSGTIYDLTVFAPLDEKQVLEVLPSVKCGK